VGSKPSGRELEKKERDRRGEEKKRELEGHLVDQKGFSSM